MSLILAKILVLALIVRSLINQIECRRCCEETACSLNDDPLEVEESIEVGVAVRRPLGALHNEELVEWELDAGSQTLDLGLELALRQWNIPV